MSSNVVVYLIVPTIAGGIALVPVAQEQLAVLFPQSIEPTTHTLILPSRNSNSTIVGQGSSNSLSFDFPKQSCGDVKTGNETAWYPVFIDNADLETIHRNYCADAIATIRKDTGNSSVQVASFSDRNKAVAFANQVRGEVGEPTFVSGGFQSNSSISSNEINTTEPQLQPHPNKSKPISPPNLSSCAFDFSANSNCLEQLSKYKQYAEKQIQESAQPNFQPNSSQNSQPRDNSPNSNLGVLDEINKGYWKHGYGRLQENIWNGGIPPSTKPPTYYGN